MHLIGHTGKKLTACSAVLPVSLARLAVAPASSKNVTTSAFPNIQHSAKLPKRRALKIRNVFVNGKMAIN